MKNALHDFLRRNPWSHRSLLERIFGATPFGVMLGQSKTVREINVAGVGDCYAIGDEPLATLPAVVRLAMVRDFVAEYLEPKTLLTSISPGPAADCELYCGDRWHRFWGDIGGLAPEALSFVRQPPVRYYDVSDVVVTVDSRRIHPIVQQMEMMWSGEGRVDVMSSDRVRVGQALISSGALEHWTPYLTQVVDAHIAQRLASADAAQNRRGDLFSKLTPVDWMMLAYIGNNPFLNKWELVVSVSSPGQRGPANRVFANSKRYASRLVEERLLVLSNFGLLEEVESAPVEGRIVLTWRAMMLLAQYWGARLEDMQKFHPWPQKIDSRGRLYYSTQWIDKMNAHQALCRQFMLSLALGAQVVSSGHGGAIVDIETMIGGRFVYFSGGNSREITWVTPDGVGRMGLYHSAPLSRSARLVQSSRILVEIDRATNPLNRLDDRLDRFREIWPSLRADNPVLVWVVDGTLKREAHILEQMRKRGIAGWVVGLDRLVLRSDHDWWTVNPPPFLIDQFYSSVGGMSPYRPIWRGTADPSRYTYLMGLSPWLSAATSAQFSVEGVLDKYRTVAR